MRNLSTITYLQNEMEFMPMPPNGCQWQLRIPAELGLQIAAEHYTTLALHICVHTYK